MNLAMRKLNVMPIHFFLLLSANSLNSCNDKAAVFQKVVDTSDFYQISLIDGHLWHLQSNAEAILSKQSGKQYLKLSSPEETIYIHHQFTPKTHEKYTLKLPIKSIGYSGSTNVKIIYSGHCSNYPNDSSETYYQLLEGEQIIVSIDHIFQYNHKCSKITLKATNALLNDPVALEIGAPIIVKR